MSCDGLLARRLSYRQPREGFRSGIEPVLLAAAVPAERGSRVIEGGCGAGAGMLCLAARIGELRGVAVERDPELAAMARKNFAANGFSGIEVFAADIRALGMDSRFDHAFANPPWHRAAGTPPEHVRRAAAKRGAEQLGEWIGALAGTLCRRGTLTLILPPAEVPAALRAAFRADLGSVALYPFWPKAGRAAKLLLLQAVLGGRGPLRLLPGMVLHEADGRFSVRANELLQGGGGLEI